MSPAAATPLQRKDRLERFRGVRSRLDPAGDPRQAMATAYVALPRSVSSRITVELALSPVSSHLLIGGVGSGKTTELLAVQNQLATVDDQFRAIYLDVTRQHDIANMVPGTITVQVGLALGSTLTRGTTSQTMVRLEALAHGYWEDYDPYGDHEGDGVQIPGILISPDQVADNVKQALVPLEQLIASVHETHEHIVVLLDGLDRMTDMPAFEQLVIHDIKALAGVGIGVVLVGPLRALYGLDRTIAQHFDSLHYQPWVDVVPRSEGYSFLASVLEKRIPDDLFEPLAVDAVISASGGVIRDLLSLTQSACVEAFLDGSDQVGLREVEPAIDKFGRKHLQGLRPAEIEVLQRVRTNGSFVHTSEDDLALLMTRRVLEYRDQGPVRYAVHPTIDRLLAGLGAG